jgi:MFS family permease
MVTAFAVAYGVCQIVVGRPGDARGKLLMVLGSLWAGIATILCAAMPSLPPSSSSFPRWRGRCGSDTAGDCLDRRCRALREPRCWHAASPSDPWLRLWSGGRGRFGQLIGWRATLLLLGVLHLYAGLLLLRQLRRLGAGTTLSGKPRWQEAARGLSADARALGAGRAYQRLYRRHGDVRGAGLRGGRS